MTDEQDTMEKPLTPDALFRACDVALLPFDSTAELEPVDEELGQDRAVQAVRFAIGMKHGGYNLFALGPAGTGKHAFIRRLVEKALSTWELPSDWCYVNNFAEPQSPKAVRLPAGKGIVFRDDMATLVEELRLALPAAFESEEYRNRATAVQDQFKERQEEAFNDLQARCKEREIALIRTPMGMALAPTKDGDVLGPEDFKKLSDDERKNRQTASEELQKELETLLRKIPTWEKEQREQIRQLNREVTLYAVGHSIDELKDAWADQPVILEYLEAVRNDVIEHAHEFLPEPQQPQLVLGLAGLSQAGGAPPTRRFQVNVVVHHSPMDVAHGQSDGSIGGAPLVYEVNPTQPNLVGRIENMAQFGTLVTDFTLIKAGALHRANGGCLMLDARKILTQPFAWEALKRTLRAGVITIESPAESLGWSTTVTLQPEPIPLHVKVVMLGEPEFYYLLTYYDPEFKELFRVSADFDTRIDRNEGTMLAYARLIGSLAKRAELKPLDRQAVARIIEHSARTAQDGEKLNTHRESLEDLLREADFWARDDGAGTVNASHVQRAIDAKIYRSDRLRERVQEEIRRGTIVIETAGARIGQINGLAVYQLDHFAFGKPSRITCRVRFGKGDVVDIEREVELGGPLHSKGVLILSSFLGTRFAAEQPLSLSANLVFEQSYGGVDGDSASSAELYALLSALARIPIRQSLAVTGSVDQTGRVQAIGGVNEKIEGFFDVCAARGLTGKQGVLIPATNVKHLMLRQDVVDACRQERFAIYAVEHIDRGIEILTGIPAGTADDSGEYPIGSVNRAVALRLAAFARKAQSFAAAARGQNDKRKTIGREPSR